jgi:5'-nucleotidase
LRTSMRRISALFLTLLLLLMPFPGLLQAADVEYTYHINWLQQEGVLLGDAKGLELDRAITTAEVAAFLQRALDWRIPAITTEIKDIPKGHWARAVLQTAVTNGALVPDNGKVYPDKHLTAAETCAIAERAGGLKLKLTPGATVSRGQFLHALAEAISTTITVVHTNDTHGRILSDPANSVFGWEKIATLVEEARRENPYTLMLDAGDAWHGTNEALFFKGASVVNAMNSVGVDVMSSGNHDFNYGQEWMLELSKDAAFDLVSANVYKGEGDEAARLLTPWVIREFGDLKVGIVGLTTPETVTATHPKNVVGLTFADPLEEAKAIVAELRPEVDVLIALTHLGDAADRELAEQVAGIDLIVGGHSHTELLEAEQVNGTFVTQSGEWGKILGREQVIIHEGRVVDVVSMAIPYTEDVPASPRTSKLAAEVSKKVEAELSALVGQAPKAMDGERANVRTRETDLGNLITDVMRDATGADIAVTNGGGIRASVAAGDLTVADIVTVLPFENTLYTVQLTGAQIKEALEHALRLYPEQNGGFLHVSGLTLTFDPEKPAYERLVEVKVNGVKLDDKAVYTVATNDFLAEGGDGFEAFAAGVGGIDTGLPLKEVLIDYVKATGVLRGSVEGRIKPTK